MTEPQQTNAEPPDEETGVPGLPSWRSVYLFVLGAFVVVVALLAVFARTFR